MLIAMVPLLLLFELSIWLTVWFAKPAQMKMRLRRPESARTGRRNAVAFRAGKCCLIYKDLGRPSSR